MFYEFKCGCILSIQQGRVRTCETHKCFPTGDGGRDSNIKWVKPKMYPANVRMVAGWSGR